MIRNISVKVLDFKSDFRRICLACTMIRIHYKLQWGIVFSNFRLLLSDTNSNVPLIDLFLGGFSHIFKFMVKI